MANEWTQNINYPTNMLYYKILSLVGQWYKDNALIEQSEKVKQTIIEQSFDGEFFIDNAIRLENGERQITTNKSEVCQYFALFLGIADENDNKYKKLVDTILHVFGPTRKKMKIMPEIAYANAFIGNFLRLELLLKWKKYEQVLKEVIGYYDKMAEITGTLWEHDDIARGSLNHGFASFVGVAIVKSIEGMNNNN